MTVTLCIDPGLRNLSMCIMNSNYEILLWDLYDVLDNDNYCCQNKNKDGTLCGKKCILKYSPTMNETIFTCKKHFPKNIIPITHKQKKIDEYLLQDIARSFIGRIQEIYEKNIDIFNTLDTILIELQPKCNSKMIYTSHILYGKLVDLFKNSNTIIKFVRASLKLKAYTGPEIECKLKGSYAQRKWLSVQYGYWFLENKFSSEQREKWLPTLTGRVTDKFDTLLMAINSITGVPQKPKAPKVPKAPKAPKVPKAPIVGV